MIADSPMEQLSQVERHLRLRKILKKLSYRDREILGLRFGLSDGNTHTLQEVGRIFRVTSDRVRQVEARALMQLRNPTILKQLTTE